MDLLTSYALGMSQSTFLTRPRSNGSLRIALIGVSIDHGDSKAITDFVNAQLANPQVAPMLQEGLMRWDTDGVVSLVMVDEDDTKQPLMQGFLFMSMISGRFRPEEHIQRRIWADAATGALAPFPQVPQAWWDQEDNGGELKGEEFMAFYMQWLQGVMSGG